MLRYRLPDGRSWKRLWEGWVGSLCSALRGTCAQCGSARGVVADTD